VLSGVTVEDLTSVPVQRVPAALLTPSGDKRPFPDKLSPMHAELGDKVFNSADWMWEPKLDGYRALAFIDEHGVKLRSRRGLELGEDFPRLVDELGKQSVEMVLDGEIVAFDASGKPPSAPCRTAAARPSERCSTALISCISPESTCAGRLTPTAAVTWRNACCLHPGYNLCMPWKTAWPCTRPRWQPAWKESWASARTAPMRQASAPPRGSR